MVTNEARSSLDRLRVLYVVSMFPCWSETFIVREIQALLQRGVDVRILSLRPASERLVQRDARALADRVLYPPPWPLAIWRVGREILRSPRRALEAPVLLIRHLWRRPAELSKSLVAWFRTTALVPALRTWAPDHVHAHWATYPSTAAMCLAEALGCRFSFTAHAHDIFQHDHLLARKLQHAAFTATISDFNRQLLQQRYPQSQNARIEIVRCGIPPASASRRRLPALGENVLLSVGRLDEIKGFATLVRACGVLADQGRRFKCRIIGDGPLRAELETQIERLELQPWIELTGAMPWEEIDRAMRRAGVFALASQRSLAGNMDGIPVVLMEAMAVGTPVVSTSISGIPELVENETTGLLVPPQDEAALATAIGRLWDEPALAARLSAAGRIRVIRQFNATREAARLHGLYQDTAGTTHVQTAAYRYG